MDCPHCQKANPEGAKFCISCGNPVTSSCSQCGAELPSEARFCPSCGHQLAPAVADPARARLEQYIPRQLLAKLESSRTSGGLQGERRVVTMLFCDVTGSTAAAENLDPEEWAEIMNGAFEHLIAPVYRYEGTLARLMGDAILAFFGAPIAHEDDPRRAVMAGLDIVRAIGPYRQEVQQARGVDFDIRVGINTGLVVVGEVGSDLRVEYTALGDAINVAARMEQTAERGTVQISADTHHLVTPYFEFEDLGPIDVKGKREPVEVFRVIGPRAQPARERGIEGLDSPMVGRDKELETLQRLVSELELGSGQIVSVIGDAGLGKSRIITEMRQKAAALNWLEGRSRSFETATPYSPFIDLFSAYFNLKPDETDETKYHNIKAKLAGSIAQEATLNAPFIAIMLGVAVPQEDDHLVRYLQPPQVRERIFGAVHQLLAARAAIGPTVLVFEDLHWSDPTSLELLETLLPLTHGLPLMIVAVLRPVKQEPAWRFHEVAERDHSGRYTSIALEPLDEQDSRTLVGNLLEIEDLPDQVRTLILNKAEGNPFFVEEVIRSLLDANLVVRENSHWRATAEISSIALPDTLTGLITARLDRLSEDSRQVAQTASVIGREFGLSTLTEIYQALANLDESIVDLQRRELIREKSPVPDLSYMYKHVLTQEAAYSSLLLARRRELHFLVAQCLERNSPEQVHEIARHFLGAREQGRAVPYLVEAGAQGARAYATSEAVGYYRQALEILQTTQDPKQHRQAFEGLGGALTFGNDVPGAVENYHNMFHAAKEYGDLPMQVSALNKLGFATALFQGQFPEAEEHLADAERLARQCGDLPGLAEFHMTYCYMTVPLGEFDDAIAHLGEADKIGREQDMEEPRLFGLTHTANTLTYMTRFDEAFRVAQEARELAEKLGNRKWQSELLGLPIPINHLRMGDLESANQSAEMGASLASEIVAVEQEGYARITLGQISWLRGEYESAIGHYQRALQAGRTSGLPFIQATALCGLGTTHKDISIQLTDRTSQFHSEAKELMELPLGTVTGGLAWADLGFCLLATGDVDQAGQFFDKGLNVSTAFKFLARPMLLAGSAFVALARNDVTEAAKLVQEAQEFSRERGMRHFYPLMSLAQAQVSLAQGDDNRALEEFNRGAESALELGLRPMAWQAQAGAAQVLHGLGREKEAADKRSGAFDIIHQIGDLFEDPSLRSMFLEDAVNKLG